MQFLLVFALNLLFALNLHRRLEAAADVLSGMVHADLLLLEVCISRTFHALNVRYSSLSFERVFAQPQYCLGGRRTFTNRRGQYVFDSRRTASTRVHRGHFSAPLDSPICDVRTCPELQRVQHAARTAPNLSSTRLVSASSSACTVRRK
jgi:hypothetical protein